MEIEVRGLNCFARRGFEEMGREIESMSSQCGLLHLGHTIE